MLSSFFIAFREGFEAALVIGIILAQLVKIDRKQLSKYVYMGVISGFVICAIGGYIIFATFKNLGDSSEVLLEGYMRVFAAALIAYFILWLHRNNNVSGTIKKKVAGNASIIGLFMLSFLSVFREGLELVVFNLTQVNQSSYSVAISSIGGLIVAIGLAFLIFKASVRLNLSIIFKVLGFILIFLGGELFAEGLVKIFPNGGEALDIGALSVFIIASLYIFLKNDIQRILLKNTKA